MAAWNDFEPEEQNWLEYLNPFARLQEPALVNWLLRTKLKHSNERASGAIEDVAQRGITATEREAIARKGTGAEVMDYLWPKE